MWCSIGLADDDGDGYLMILSRILSSRVQQGLIALLEGLRCRQPVQMAQVPFSLCSPPQVSLDQKGPVGLKLVLVDFSVEVYSGTSLYVE